MRSPSSKEQVSFRLLIDQRLRARQRQQAILAAFGMVLMLGLFVATGHQPLGQFLLPLVVMIGGVAWLVRDVWVDPVEILVTDGVLTITWDGWRGSLQKNIRLEDIRRVSLEACPWPAARTIRILSLTKDRVRLRPVGYDREEGRPVARYAVTGKAVGVELRMLGGIPNYVEEIARVLSPVGKHEV